MKRALLLALLLAAVIAVVSLRTYHAGEAPPEPSEALPQSAMHADSVENSESAIESANALSAPARESLVLETNTSAGSPTPGADSVVHIQVRYSGSKAPVRSAKAILGHLAKEARTDESGVAEIRVPEGSMLSNLRIEANDDGDPFVPFERALDHKVLPGRNDIKVFVDRGTDVRGIVREAGSGRAVPGATVYYHGFGHRPKVVTEQDGSFVCQALLVNFGNPCTMTVERDGYLPSSVKPQPADIVPGAPPLIVLLETGLIVSGRVVDADRKPIAGVHLELRAPRPSQTVSDEQGRFEFGGLRPVDQASLSAQTQALSSSPILGSSLELGALPASRFEIEFTVQRAIEVRVFAELPDGSSLDVGKFDVDWGDNALARGDDPWLIPRFVDRHSGVLPLGREIELRAFARAPGADDPGAILSGTARIHARADTRSPLDVRIHLSEKGRLDIPPLPPGAGEIDLGQGSEIRGALDVQVFDADSGQPIEGVIDLVYPRTFGGTDYTSSVVFQSDARPLRTGANGWIRIWHSIGTRSATVTYGLGPLERLSITIPRSGYAKAEWRLRSKP